MTEPQHHDVGKPIDELREHTHVTARAVVPNLLRVRKDWPEHEGFIAHLDALKKNRKLRYDSALAELADVDPSTISNWRSGKQRPSLKAITDLAIALDVDPTDLAARAGVAEGLARASTPTRLAPELEILIDQWQTADPNRRAELVARVAWISEWFDATAPPASERPRRAG
ncbi:helix-turn-helix domain-containing protein [Micromonospora taraxaci]|uniref:helix-turn-helix domain-containing protein n=1 Tax=Micromonospora taraxaci TaxID=1316803 RepID=UPI0033B6926D